jgi:hypothetical protein
VYLSLASTLEILAKKSWASLRMGEGVLVGEVGEFDVLDLAFVVLSGHLGLIQRVLPVA